MQHLGSLCCLGCTYVSHGWPRKDEITLVGLGPGFVSWALQTKLSVGRPLKAYEFGASVYASRISADELRHGDIITQ